MQICSSKKLSIILVNYNTAALTMQCIESIYKHLVGYDFEIILVDNCSIDDSVLKISSSFPDIKIIANSENLGFGRANNQALRIATGEYCFLLNTDTIIFDDSIQKMLNFLDSHQDISIVGAQLLNAEKKLTHSYSSSFPSIFWEIMLFLYPIARLFRWKEKYILRKHGFIDVAYITGADMLIRKRDLDVVGLFDEDFFMYFEETDLSYRFKCHGFRSVFYPSSQIIHLEGASFSFKERRERLYYDSRKLFYEKHYNNRYCMWANRFHYLSLICWYLASYIIRRDMHNVYAQKISLFKNYK